jgi:hypothetical protein
MEKLSARPIGSAASHCWLGFNDHHRPRCVQENHFRAIWQETTLRGIYPRRQHATMKTSLAKSPTFRIAAWMTEYDTSGSVADSLVAAGYSLCSNQVVVLQV